MRPTSEDYIVRVRFVEQEGIRLYRVASQCLGSETNLSIRLYTSLQIRIEDAIDDGPIVDWIAVRVFGVGVRAAPFEPCSDFVDGVTGREQIVCSEVCLVWTQITELREEGFAI
jgi:hypothetical protein